MYVKYFCPEQVIGYFKSAEIHRLWKRTAERPQSPLFSVYI